MTNDHSNYPVSSLDPLTRAANHLQTTVVPQLGGSQLLLSEGAADQPQLGLGGLEEGEETGRALSLLLAHQLLQSLGYRYDVLVILLHLVL